MMWLIFPGGSAALTTVLGGVLAAAGSAGRRGSKSPRPTATPIRRQGGERRGIPSVLPGRQLSGMD